MRKGVIGIPKFLSSIFQTTGIQLPTFPKLSPTKRKGSNRNAGKTA
jgi:hypothetical protein